MRSSARARFRKRHIPHVDPRDQLKGYVRRATGRSLETMLETLHDTYALQGRAMIAKNWPETAGPPGKMRYVRKSTVDYDGFLPGGRAIHFDAKGITKNASFIVSPKEAHQLAHLRAARDNNVIAFFLLWDHDLARGWLLGGDALDELAPYDRRVVVRVKDGNTYTSRFPALDSIDYLACAVEAFG